MNYKEKIEYINKMLTLIMESSHSMPNYVFHYFVDAKINPKEKIFYNLIADSFLTLYSYCNLMFSQAWSQAFALLRVAIEEVSTVYVLIKTPGALEEYLKLNDSYKKYIQLDSKEEKEEFLNELNIKEKDKTRFFDYGWISKFTNDKSYGRNQIIEKARLSEFINDIKESLNAFAHGKISVFQMSGRSWEVMRDYGIRANLTTCKLFDFLCCSYHDLIGDSMFGMLPFKNSYIAFKSIYNDLLIKEGWEKQS